MKKVKFIVEKGCISSDEKQFGIDTSTMHFVNPVPVYFNFDMGKQIGYAMLSIEEGFVFAEMELPKEVLKLYTSMKKVNE